MCKYTKHIARKQAQIYEKGMGMSSVFLPVLVLTKMSKYYKLFVFHRGSNGNRCVLLEKYS